MKKQRHNRSNHSESTGQGSYWMYGYHAIQAALTNPSRKKHQFLALKTAATEFSSHNPRLVSKEEIEAVLPKGAVHQGLALQVAPLRYDIDDLMDSLEKEDKATLVLLDQVSDIHNVGAVLRSSAAFGVSAVIIPINNAPGENGSIAKSACGALDMVPLVQVVNISQTIKKLKEAGFWSIGLDSHKDTLMGDFSFPKKSLFVFGSEGEGMRRLTKDNCDYIVKLGMDDRMESLNLSNAVAITLYERYNNV